MHGTLIAPAAAPQNARLAIWTGLFWMFSYGVLSTRAQLLAIDSSIWVSEMRVVAITTGALMFGALLWMIDRFAAQTRNPLLFVAATLPASLVILAIRLVMEHALSDAPLPFTDHARWMLVWAGYFGVGICAYLIVRTPPAAQVRLALLQEPSAVSTARGDTRAAPAELADTDDWEWVLDALAQEMASGPPAHRMVLIQNLRARVGYEIADELGMSLGHNARVRLVERLAARLSGSSAPRPR
jgi:hypothetical protein